MRACRIPASLKPWKRHGIGIDSPWLCAAPGLLRIVIFSLFFRPCTSSDGWLRSPLRTSVATASPSGSSCSDAEGCVFRLLDVLVRRCWVEPRRPAFSHSEASNASALSHMSSMSCGGSLYARQFFHTCCRSSITVKSLHCWYTWWVLVDCFLCCVSTFKFQISALHIISWDTCGSGPAWQQL